MPARRRTSRSSDSGAAGRRGRGSDGEHAQGRQTKRGLIQGTTFGVREVEYSVIDGVAIFEGDIVLGTDAEVQRRTQELRARMSGAPVAFGVAITGAQFRWPNCTIPYTIETALPSQSRVTDAIAHWTSNTRYRFVPRTTETDYVTFRASTGCSSNVGRQSQQQFVNLGSGCTTGNCIHEIGHVVGLWHEQSREDRDSFVTIHWDKIQAGMEHNFDQHITDGDDIGAYEYGSIMHYPRDAFSVDGSDTITPVQAGVTIGQRTGLSAGDIAAANSLCPKPIKEGLKEPLVDTGRETIKEPPKDLKEPIKDPLRDTIKERIKEPIKEIKEPIKERKEFKEFKEPFKDRKEPLFDPIGPGPIRGLPGPQIGLPFAMTAPHQAQAAMEAGTASADALASQVQTIGEQLAQLDQLRAELEAEYQRSLAALEHVMAAGGEGTG